MIPGGCTGYVQVLDVTVNKPLKDYITKLAEKHYDEHLEQWTKEAYTVGDQRVMLTKWIGQVWEDIHKTHEHVIQRTFQ